MAIFSATETKQKEKWKTLAFCVGETYYYPENNTQAKEKSMSTHALHSSTRLSNG
jgi:hypothetical protein